MDPNQQPNQNPQPAPQPTPPTPAQQPVMPPSQPQQRPPQPAVPAEPKYSTGQSAYDPNYLDTIAPQAAPPKFFSGSFGKIFFLMIFLFAVAVSMIVAFSGKDNTADLQQMVVRLDNFEKTAKTVHKNLKSSNLAQTNSVYMIWLADAARGGQELLDLGGVKKTDYSKDMVRSEEAYAASLDQKFEDARLSARLHRVYSTTMALEIEKLLSVFTTLQKNPSSKIQEYATDAKKNLDPIHKEFSEFVDDGN